MNNIAFTPPGWTLVQMLVVTAIIFLEWQVLTWLRGKIK